MIKETAGQRHQSHDATNVDPDCLWCLYETPRARYQRVMDRIAHQVADVRCYVPRELAEERDRLEAVLGIAQ